MFLCFRECSIVYRHFTDTTLPNTLRFFSVNISNHSMKECQITSIFLAKENAKWIPQVVIYVLSIKLFKTRIIWIYFITILRSCIAKYSLEIWLFIAKCVCLWSYIHWTSVQKSVYVYDPTYIRPYELGREQHRALKYGLGKKKSNINI